MYIKPPLPVSSCVLMYKPLFLCVICVKNLQPHCWADKLGAQVRHAARSDPLLQREQENHAGRGAQTDPAGDTKPYTLLYYTLYPILLYTLYPTKNKC
jgi:hypothetical protein